LDKKRIVVVGGGTAGWIAVNLLAKQLCSDRWQVVAVESSQVPTIGVGEGSTPQLRSLLNTLEIDEAEFMSRCNATYKNGIRFNNWSTRRGATSYFHPFPTDLDAHSVPAFFYNSFMRRQGIDLDGDPDRYFLSTRLAEKGLSPKPQHSFPFDVQYGYHFDAGLFAGFLKSQALKQGVIYIDDTVNEIELSPTGAIAALKGAQYIKGDMFVDCTGFRSLLLQGALKVGFKSFSSNLKNDRAVVMQTELDESIESHTTSTALSAGWAWRIPLANRVGNGYVYSSSYLSDEQAESEFRAHLGEQGMSGDVRFLSMKVGQVEQHWASNCLAVGLSQGFIEPLEATAIHLAQETVEGFISAFNNGQYEDKDRKSFNKSICSRFEAVRDYIVCHYRLTSRQDSDYWRDAAKNPHVSQSLASVINTWTSGKNLSEEIDRQGIGEYYPSASWHCILAGYGIYPNNSQLVAASTEVQRYQMADIDDFLERCTLNFSVTSEVASA